MTPATWFAFLATSCAVVAIPGPTAFIIMRHASGRCRGQLARIVAGAVLGDTVALTICNCGLGTLLAASSGVLTGLEYVSAAFLIGLGFKTLQRPSSARSQLGKMGRPFTNVFLVTAFNPKGIVFFCALMPQFVDADAPVIAQFAIMQATFCAVSLAGATSWTLVGLSLSRVSEGHLARRLSGLFLIGAGFLQAARRFA